MNEVFNYLVVVKRSGQRVCFNGLKIALAIKKAFDSVTTIYSESEKNKIYEDTLNYIGINYTNRKTINVEDIQDIIEDKLNNKKYRCVYEEFSKYRIKRAESRKAFSIKQQHKFVKAIEKIDNINLLSSKPNELLISLAETISSEYTKSYIIDNKYVKAHEEGKIFSHQLSYFSLGYLGSTHLMLDKYIKEDYFSELLYLLISAKKEINGEIAIDDFDNLLSEFVLNKFKKDLLYKIKKYFEISEYLEYINIVELENKIVNLDSINITEDYSNILKNKKTKNIFDLAYIEVIKEINDMLNKYIYKLLLVLNKEKNYSINLGSSKTKEGLLIQKIFLEILEEKTFKNINIIYKVNNKTNLESIGKVILNKNNIKLNFDNQNDNYFSTGLKLNDARGKSNIANVSLNISRISLKHKIKSEFYEELDKMIDMALNELEFIFETIGDKKKENYEILFNNNILDDDKLELNQKIRKVIKSGSLNVNLIGLKECAMNLDFQNYNLELIKILKYIKSKINIIAAATKLNFTLSSIRYDDISSYLIDIDKAAYGLINNVTRKENYENISNVKINQIEDIKEIQKILNGGNVLELNTNKNIKLKKVVDILNILKENKISLAYLIVGDK